MSETRFSDLTLSGDLTRAQDIGYNQPVRKAPYTGRIWRDIMVNLKRVLARQQPLALEAGEPTKGVKALVLCPTRELKSRSPMSLNGSGSELRTVPVYGGASIDKQVAEINLRTSWLAHLDSPRPPEA